MASDRRRSARRSTRGPAITEEVLPIEQNYAFPTDKKIFFRELVEFHNNNHTPLPRFPTLSGKQIDLFELYCAVVNRGGVSRATLFDSWNEIAEVLALQPCSNLTVALRQIYGRYLSHYESITISMDEEHDDDYDEMGGIFRRKIPNTTVANIPIPMTYHHDQHRHSRSANHVPSKLCRHSACDKIYLGFLSGLPNEYNFLLDTCLLLSLEPAHCVVLTDSQPLLIIVAHLGIFAEDSIFASLFSECWEKHSKTDFCSFWLSTTSNMDIKSSFINDLPFRNRSLSVVGSSFFSSSLFTSDSREYSRVLRTLHLIRNMSFEAKNLHVLTAETGLKKFLLMCSGSIFGSLKVLALDALANITRALELSSDPIDHLLVVMALSELQSEDTVVVIRSMEILSNLCLEPRNGQSLLQNFDGDICRRILAMLTVQDLLVLLSCVEFLYQFSYLGAEACEKLLDVKYTVDKLAHLITFDVQSMGLDALTSVRVIEQPKSLSSRNAISATASNMVEVEKFVIKWLLTFYEATDDSNAQGLLSNEVFSIFRTSCQNQHPRLTQIQHVQFVKCFRLAFPAANFKSVNSVSENINPVFVTGVKRRVTDKIARLKASNPQVIQQAPLSGVASASPVVSSSSSSQKPPPQKPYPIKPQPNYATSRSNSPSAVLSTPSAAAAAAAAQTAPPPLQVPSATEAPPAASSHVPPVSTVAVVQQNTAAVSSAAAAAAPMIFHLVLPGARTESAFKKPDVKPPSNVQSNDNPPTTLVLNSGAGGQFFLSAVPGGGGGANSANVMKAVIKPVPVITAGNSTQQPSLSHATLNGNKMYGTTTQRTESSPAILMNGVHKPSESAKHPAAANHQSEKVSSNPQKLLNGRLNGDTSDYSSIGSPGSPANSSAATSPESCKPNGTSHLKQRPLENGFADEKSPKDFLPSLNQSRTSAFEMNCSKAANSILNRTDTYHQIVAKPENCNGDSSSAEPALDLESIKTVVSRAQIDIKETLDNVANYNVSPLSANSEPLTNPRKRKGSVGEHASSNVNPLMVKAVTTVKRSKLSPPLSEAAAASSQMIPLANQTITVTPQQVSGSMPPANAPVSGGPPRPSGVISSHMPQLHAAVNTVLSAGGSASNQSAPRVILQPVIQSSAPNTPGSQKTQYAPIIFQAAAGVPPSAAPPPRPLSPEVQVDPPNGYKCEWGSCSRKFARWQDVFQHCCRMHCRDIGPEGAVCEWSVCDGLRRKKFSLYTHLHEKHCTESQLDRARKAASASASGQQQQQQKTATGSSSQQPPHPNPESLYSMHTLHHALLRSGWTPPAKDSSLSVIEKEGPVSKAVRLNAALVLRNLTRYSERARHAITPHERKLALVATSCTEASPFLASCLLNLCNL